jgi:hypothetical protein
MHRAGETRRVERKRSVRLAQRKSVSESPEAVWTWRGVINGKTEY